MKTQLSYEALRGQLNAMSARSPPPSAPPPPPGQPAGPIPANSPTSSSKGRWVQGLKRSGKRSMSFSLGGFSGMFRSGSNKQIPQASPASSIEIPSKSPLPQCGRTASFNTQRSAKVKPKFDEVDEERKLRPNQPPSGKATPKTDDSNESKSRPPPPRWSQLAEQEYFLGVGKRLEIQAEENFKLKERIKVLHATLFHESNMKFSQLTVPRRQRKICEFCARNKEGAIIASPDSSEASNPTANSIGFKNEPAQHQA